jgi:ABC-type sugar transport system permease subunit
MGYLLILPAVSVVLIFILYPILQALFYSLTDKNVFQSDTSFIGFENFRKLWNDGKFWNALQHSLLLTAIVVPLEYILGLSFALLLNQRLRFVPSLRNWALMSWVIPIASQVMLFRWMFSADDGIVNRLLHQIGLGAWAIPWFGDPSTAFGMIVLMHLWRNAPFWGLTLLAGMQSIPGELYEAATVDGAGPWHRLVHITLPHLRRISMIIIVGHVAFTLNEYEFVAIATGGGPVGATEVLPTYLTYQAWQRFDLGYASAIGTVMLVILLMFAIPYIYSQERKERER